MSLITITLTGYRMCLPSELTPKVAPVCLLKPRTVDPSSKQTVPSHLRPPNTPQSRIKHNFSSRQDPVHLQWLPVTYTTQPRFFRMVFKAPVTLHPQQLISQSCPHTQLSTYPPDYLPFTKPIVNAPCHGRLYYRFPATDLPSPPPTAAF